MRATSRQWEVESTEEFDDWLEQQEAEDQDRFEAALRHLERAGPSLGRPVVDTIKASKHQNMKELRVGTLRILFIFDPDKKAVLLLGGDKTNRWQEWYDENIPRADALYDRYLEERKQKQLEELRRQADLTKGTRGKRERGKRP